MRADVLAVHPESSPLLLSAHFQSSESNLTLTASVCSESKAFDLPFILRCLPPTLTISLYCCDGQSLAVLG